MEYSIVLLATAAVTLFAILRAALTIGHRTRQMPNGPPTVPFLGNLLQIPTKHSHVQMTKWAREYGGLYMLKMGHGNIAVITDRRLVKEVVDRKSGIYSHRPPSYVSHGLITKGNHLLVMHYGDQWRQFRRLIHPHFMESMVENHHVNIVNAEAIQMVHDYLHDPENHMLHPKRYSNSITMSIVYGIRTATHKGSNMNRLYNLMEEWSQLMEPGATPPVDLLPWLKYIPERFFGNYVSRAKAVGRQMENLYADNLRRVMKRRDDGTNLDTFMDRVLDGQEKNQLPWHQLCFIGGVLMEGGSDTSSSLTIAIVQALTLNPEIQRKAHEELDRVVGSDRSPVWEDMKNLPYINCIVKEGHRWRPILPLCFPHALGEDDWVDGKLLPKGTMVLINTWGMHMNEQQWEKPEEFIPERYANHPMLAPEYAAGKWEARDHFGYGVARRICPGIHLAERNMLLAISKLLWAFRFEAGAGKCDPDPVTGYHSGFLYCAKDYGTKPVVRSEAIRATIEKELAIAQRDVFSQFKEG